MTVIEAREIKTKIQKKIEELPVDSLPNVLNFLNELQQHPEDSDAEFEAHLKKIVSENKGLLKKLAE